MARSGLLSNLGFNRNVTVLGLSSAVATFGNLLWYFFLPILFQRYGLNGLEIASIYSAGLVLAAIVQVPVGSLVDKHGRKTSIVIGGLVGSVSLATWAFSFSQNLLGFAVYLSIAAYLSFEAIGNTMIAIGRDALIMQSSPSKTLATNFGAFFTLAGSVSALGPVIGGYYLLNGKPTILFAAGSLLLLAVAAARGILLVDRRSERLSDEEVGIGRVPKKSKARLREEFKQLVGNRNLVALTLAYAVYNMFISSESIGFLVPLYSVATLHLSTAVVGLMFTASTLASSLLSIPFGKAADRYGRKSIVIISWVCEMIFMMVFAYSVGIVFSVLSFLAWQTFGALDGPALQGLLGQETSNQTRGISLGFFNTLNKVVLIPSTIITGLLYVSGTSLPFIANLLIGVISLILFVRLFGERTSKKTTG